MDTTENTLRSSHGSQDTLDPRTEHMSGKEREIYASMQTAMHANPNAQRIFMEREGLTSQEQVDDKLAALTHDIASKATLGRGIEGKFQNSDKVYNGAYDAFDQAMAKDLPDDAMRHAFAEKAANKFTEVDKGVNPHHEEMQQALIKEVLPHEVDRGVDQAKAQLQQKASVFGPLGEGAMDTALNGNIIANMEGLKPMLKEALGQVVTQDGFFELSPEQQHRAVAAKVKEAALEHFAEFAPGDAHLLKIGDALPDPMKAAVHVLHGSFRDGAADLIAGMVADKVVPSASRDPMQNVMEAVNVGMHDVGSRVVPTLQDAPSRIRLG